MNQHFPYYFLERQLRVSSLCGWIYSTPGYRKDVDKAGFHAIAPIGGIDEQP